MAFKEICRIAGKTGVFELAYAGGRITELNPLPASPAAPQTSLWASPGLFDIQVNGMLGYNLSGEELTGDQVMEIDRELEKHGVTRWCPTVTTQDPAVVERSLGVIGGVMAGGGAPNIHCIHLEGHYISGEEGYRGVHLEGYIRDPDPAEFERWQQAAGGRIGLFSLAPERRGALELIRRLKGEGVKVGLAHHHADHGTVCAAAAAGADLSTHLINGCARLIHRQHNIIWSQLSLEELWASFIADGYHIPSYTIRAAIRAKGIDRSILVSDLAHLSGLPDGEYDKMEKTVVLRDGGLWVKGEGTNLLSGAVKTLEQDCAWLTAQAGFSVEQALLMASLHPARYFGIEGQAALYPGRPGPCVVFSGEAGAFSVWKVLK
jgi:N-acetylglucosamine-6-phosphate deacetylase